MGVSKLFQICYEGELTVEVSDALRRLNAEPNFDQSWQVALSGDWHAASLVRYLRLVIGSDPTIFVAQTQHSLDRDFLLLRHSLTSDADYSELHRAIQRLGSPIEIPFESTLVIETPDRTDATTLGRALGELCPDESLMVVGIAYDFAFAAPGGQRMFIPRDARHAAELRPF